MFKANYVVIGAGLTGSIIARELANAGKSVLVLERREHVAGNAYDFYDSHGIRVQKYGPHVFHTFDQKIYEYITQFCEPIPYKTFCEVCIDGLCTPSPFNFKTIDQFFSNQEALKLKRKLMVEFKGAKKVSIIDLLNSSDKAIRNYALFLFEKDYKLYTAKQWGIPYEAVDPTVLKRVPIRLSYDASFFDDPYEFIPRNGFTDMASNILSHNKIRTLTGKDALRHITIDDKNYAVKFDGKCVCIVFTGPIDELFNSKYGDLPYRSLFFKYSSINRESFQNVAIVAYPQDPSFTRITEYSKMPFQNGNGWTTIAHEYPTGYIKSNAESEPYYPILTEKSQKINDSYQEYAKLFKNLYLCGRLADFRYYNMDQAVLAALGVAERIKRDNFCYEAVEV